jgi:RNA polymerase sigma factor (sigma-70 family)
MTVAVGEWLEENKGMLVNIVNRYHMTTSKFSREDLEQEAALGACRAIGQFDETKNKSKLSTYVWSAVNRACRDFVRRNKYDLFESDYYQSKEWKESEALKAEAGDEGDEVVHSFGRFATTEGPMAVRIDSSSGGAEDGWSLVDSIPSGDPCGYEYAARMEQIKLLKGELKDLPERERVIVSAIYFDNKSVSDIAVEQGVTRQRISQISNRALRRLTESVKVKLGQDILI